ncbi:MAG: PD-(D/E)XK nuclease family protein [Woeseiaceae bacterium]
MYDWLREALDGPATLITANRRLARVLREEYAEQQQRAGLTAWASPRIQAFPDWLDAALRATNGQEHLPTRINQYHSTLLWDRCLRKELGDNASGVGNLVRLSRETWQRLSDWNVTIKDVARSAQSHDHRLFAAAAGRYLGILERSNWVDDAGVASLVADLIRAGRLTVAGRYTFAGFDRDRPSIRRIRNRLAEAGCDVRDVAERPRRGRPQLAAFESSDAELRAAGAWARARIEQSPGERVAIVANGLERDAERLAGLVREGLIPGYRMSAAVPAEALNVSYGRKLARYPIVSVGLLWLRWLARDLRAGEVSHLLRSPLLGLEETCGRARLEMRVRGLPDRNWSPSMLTGAIRSKKDSADATDWLQRVSALAKARRELPGTASPATWAVTIDETLRAAGWPGQRPLDSGDFQLVNRWRDLLNDLARMDLVSGHMTLETALNQLESMCADAVFQPEAELTRVHLLGPLEASGLEFDAIRLTGMTAANWPPAGNPSALVSRRLQEAHGMPDATPADTVANARRLVARLCASAAQVVCSYPLTEDEADQTPSLLLESMAPVVQEAEADPGIFASQFVGTVQIADATDPVPPIGPSEQLPGGAWTIQSQLTEPVAAFIGSRLGVRVLDEQASGLPPLLRGNLIHDALYSLYFDKPSRDDLASWTDVDGRISKALDFAFSDQERNTDKVLLRLFAMERDRVRALLREFLALDASRDAFVVASVEREIEFSEAGVQLKLRVDRIDRLPDGRIAILDYKTGAEKKFLTAQGQPREFQLVAYACAVDEPVAALALVNVDSRTIGFSGAGVGYSDSEVWPGQLAEWSALVRSACQELSVGDVRLDPRQPVIDARPLNLLTRFTELRNDW